MVWKCHEQNVLLAKVQQQCLIRSVDISKDIWLFYLLNFYNTKQNEYKKIGEEQQ